MDCPFWISPTFLKKLSEEYKQMYMSKEIKELERLETKIEADYRSWSEKILKDVPQCCRAFTKTLKAYDSTANTHSWNKAGTLMAEFTTKSLVCAVNHPNLSDTFQFTSYSSLASSEVFGYVDENHPCFSDMLNYKRIKNNLNVQLYCKCEYSNSSKRFADSFSIGGLDYRFEDYANKRLAEYIKETRENLNWACTGIEPEKPAVQEPVQLELF